jgi:endonuclease/exonuclease/phosphatase family metal-dependent hydrolase
MTRLCTYNIHKCVGADGRFNPARVVAVIRDIGADILAVQEFVPDERSEITATADRFADACGYRAIEQKMRRRNGKPQSNLLLTRMAIRHVRLFPMAFPGVEERGAICAEAELASGGLLRVAATHLGLPPLTRKRQLRALLQACVQDSRKPFVLLGDLNILPFLDPANALLRSAFPRQEAPATFPSRWPLVAFDRIALRGTAFKKLRAWAERGAPFASDHLPLVADIAV